MLQLRQYLDRRLSPPQTVAVIVIVMVLGGLGYAAYQFIAVRLFEARVRAAMPGVCAKVREQRGTLVRAIEAYKARFGVYPPDHVISRQPVVVDPVTNTLLYELVGAIYNPASKELSVGGLEPAEAAYVKGFFQIDAFRNCAESQGGLQHFLPAENVPVMQLHDDPDVFVLSVAMSYEELTPDIFYSIGRGSWRYVSSAPTNNPGRFDLWIEVKANGQKVTIGNWRAVE
jgi:hypothetical protein